MFKYFTISWHGRYSPAKSIGQVDLANIGCAALKIAGQEDEYENWSSMPPSVDQLELTSQEDLAKA